MLPVKLLLSDRDNRGRTMRQFILIALLALPFSANADTVVYTARKIITMEPALPEASAVMVEGDRIVAVGTLDSLAGLIELRDARIDQRLADKILMPGFIDPHVHPALPAVLTQFPFLAPDDWSLPTGEFPGATTPGAFETRLKALVADFDQQDAPFIAWGYHPLWHGQVYREQLNDWFPETAVMLWHRSFHELIGNDAAFSMLGVTEADAVAAHEADWTRGHFWENGLKALVPKLGFLFQPDRFATGMANFLEMLHRGGVTTALDMGTGIFGNPQQEIQLIRSVAEQSAAPSRMILTPIITDFLARGRTPGAS